MANSKTNTILTLSAVALGSILLFTNIADADSVEGPHEVAPAAVIESLLLEVPFQGGAFAFVDLGKNGLSPGDMFVSSDMPVSNASTGKKLGSMDGWEIILSAHHNGTVAGTTLLRLPDGNVTIDGTVRHTDDPNTFAVTGGTGTYAGVSGTMEVVRENTRRKVVIMRLELTR
jgi:hypothetical protein